MVDTVNRPSGGLPLIFWGNREARRLDMDGQRTYLTRDLSTIMDCLLEVPGAVQRKSHIIFQLYVAQGREEPLDAEKSLHVSIHKLREQGIPITNIHGTGYCLGLPPSDYEQGTVYQGKDDVGCWRVLKIYREPTLLLQSIEGCEEVHIPVSSAKFWGLKRAVAG